jgi:sulfatase maturation enzyme AslB (radical SAM superfamily)
MALDDAGNAIFLDKDAKCSISSTCGSQVVLTPKKVCLFCRVVCGGIQRVLGLVWPTLKTHCANSYYAELAVAQASKNLPGSHGGAI